MIATAIPSILWTREGIREIITAVGPNLEKPRIAGFADVSGPNDDADFDRSIVNYTLQLLHKSNELSESHFLSQKAADLPVPNGISPNAENMKSHGNGELISEDNNETLVGDKKEFSGIAKIWMHPTKSPQDCLIAVENGFNIVAVDFCLMATDGGFALTFELETSSKGTAVPAHNSESMENIKQLEPWFMDLRDAKFEVDQNCLVTGCDCRACKTYSRAYIHHLLKANELLAWTLLQM